MDEMSLNVSLSGMFGEFSAGVKIPKLYYQCFAPLASGDVPLISAMNNEATNEEVKLQMEIRKDAADIIAKELAEFLVNEMKRRDTHNGYPVSREI